MVQVGEKERFVMRERSAATLKPKHYVQISAPYEANERLVKHESRLAQMGLKDPNAARKMNGGKIIDQMQWHTDLMDADYSAATNDLKKVSQKARAHQLPLGGVLGERIAKSISLYETEPVQVKAKQHRTIAHEPTDYNDAGPKLAAPRPIDNSLQYSGMKISNVQTTKGADTAGGSMALLDAGRSSSIEQGSNASGGVRRGRLEGAIQQALQERKKSQQSIDTMTQKRIPMRTPKIKKGVSAAR